MPIQLPRSAKIAAAIFALVWFTHRTVIEILIDWMWFDAAGYLGVFETSLKARIALFVAGFVVLAPAPLAASSRGVT